ncbi:L-aspartate oxidase [Clostridiaceae bacterium HSG29]|nr:L-aspartate oxidase [Clostridiaceae bacterium HSG29]
MKTELVKPMGDENSIYDVVIIGSGIAGLYTALTLNSKYNIMVITKNEMKECNSNYAQGGVAAALEEEDFNNHIKDTLTAGSDYNDKAVVDIIIKEAKENIMNLIDYGVNFDRNEDGTLKKTKEGGHSKSRIVHYKDSTGEEIIRALIEESQKRKNIDIFEKTFCIDLIKEDSKVTGVILQKGMKRFDVIASKVIIAAGGIGKLFLNSTNSIIATGDGVSMALRARAEVMDMEFIQFHPTGLNIQEERNFLISEALRGEGAVLRNQKGELFMEKYHTLKDLAPRDIVSQSITYEMEFQKIDGVFLDITHKDSKYVKERFPQIYNHCLEFGIDITKEYIPVIPIHHYLMGGVKVDINGKTTVDNLYACGEVSRTGIHGANRLASNSLLEAIVTGNRISKDINMSLEKTDCKNEINYYNLKLMKEYDYINEINEIRNIMSSNVFIIRYKTKLEEALEKIQKISYELEENNTIAYYEVRNMLVTAKKIIEDALNRKESLGSHKIFNK